MLKDKIDFVTVNKLNARYNWEWLCIYPDPDTETGADFELFYTEKEARECAEDGEPGEIWHLGLEQWTLWSKEERK